MDARTQSCLLCTMHVAKKRSGSSVALVTFFLSRALSRHVGKGCLQLLWCVSFDDHGSALVTLSLESFRACVDQYDWRWGLLLWVGRALSRHVGKGVPARSIMPKHQARNNRPQSHALGPWQGSALQRRFRATWLQPCPSTQDGSRFTAQRPATAGAGSRPQLSAASCLFPAATSTYDSASTCRPPPNRLNANRLLSL